MGNLLGVGDGASGIGLLCHKCLRTRCEDRVVGGVALRALERSGSRTKQPTSERFGNVGSSAVGSGDFDGTVQVLIGRFRVRRMESIRFMIVGCRRCIGILGGKPFVGLLCIVVSISTMAQLLPEVEVDRYVAKAERQVRSEEYDNAVMTLHLAEELSAVEGVELPQSYWLVRAQAMIFAEKPAAAVRFETAENSLIRFLELTGGRQSPQYAKALELLDTLDRIKATTCDLPKEIHSYVEKRLSGCIEELHGTHGSVQGGFSCANAVLVESTWEGFACMDQHYVAEGLGSVVAKVKTTYGRVRQWNSQFTFSGLIREGRAVGEWRESVTRGDHWLLDSGYRTTSTVTFEKGVLQGSYFGETSTEMRAEGLYVAGLKQGLWTIDEKYDGRTCKWSGQYLNDRRVGQWTSVCRNGEREQVDYLEGRRVGKLLRTNATTEEIIYEVPYIGGLRHGVGIMSGDDPFREVWVAGKKLATLWSDGFCQWVEGETTIVSTGVCSQTEQDQILKMIEQVSDR